MRIITSRGEILNRQTSSTLWLQQVPVAGRIAIGLVGCALVAFYAPLFALLLTGNWSNVLTMWIANSIIVAVLACINLVVTGLGRPALGAVIVTVILDIYVAQLTARTHTLADWRNWWQNLFFNNAAMFLNTYLYIRFRRATNLK